MKKLDDTRRVHRNAAPPTMDCYAERPVDKIFELASTAPKTAPPQHGLDTCRSGGPAAELLGCESADLAYAVPSTSHWAKFWAVNQRSGA